MLHASFLLGPCFHGASHVQIPVLASHAPFKLQSRSVLQLPTGGNGGGGGRGGGGGGGGGGDGPGTGGGSPSHAYNVQPESPYDAFQCVVYNCARAVSHLGLYPKLEQFDSLLHAASASEIHEAEREQVNSSFLACSDFGPMVFGCATYSHPIVALPSSTRIAAIYFYFSHQSDGL